MATQLVPGPPGTSAFYEQTTALDGTPYRLLFSYSQREGTWSLLLSTVDGEAVYSMKLVCNWDLLRTCASPLRPPGRLLVRSNTTDASSPGLLDLAVGARCVIGYVPAADVAAVLAGGA